MVWTLFPKMSRKIVKIESGFQITRTKNEKKIQNLRMNLLVTEHQNILTS
jgi:hypothetical protein